MKKKCSTIFALFMSITIILTTLTGCGAENQQGSLSGFSTENSGSETASSDGAGNGNNTASSNAFGSTSSGADSNVASGTGIGADTTVDEQQAIKDAFYADNGQGSAPVWAGTQYYNGDVVNIWRKMNGSEDLQKAQDIYMYDSKDYGKVIARGVPSTAVGNWFYTYDGLSLNAMGSKLQCFLADGTEKFNISAEAGVGSIVQLEDNTIVLLIKEADNSHTLAILDVEKGEYKKVPDLDLGNDKRLFISAGENGVVLLNKDGFHDVNLETGELTLRRALNEYDYDLKYDLKSFRLEEGATVKLLYQGHTENILPKDIGKYRTVITMQFDNNSASSNLQILLDEFNAKNTRYYAVLINHADPDSPYSNEEEVFAGLASGGGADLIYARSMYTSDVDKAVQLGYFEDLAPYMAKSGVYEEDYFPTTFEKFKVGDGIYGAFCLLNAIGLSVKKEVLGGRDIRNLEDFVDALLNYTEPSVFDVHAAHMLMDLLEYSDSLAGTVDWESGTCNFHSNLFAKLLEVCMLYDHTDSDLLPTINKRVYTKFYGYLNEDQRDLEGYVYLGQFFDDGLYPGAVNYNSIHINANSQQKEGAWAVLNWLLSEDAQDQDDFSRHGHPRFVCSNIYAFEKVVLTEMEETVISQRYNESTKDMIEYRKYIPADISYMEIRKMKAEDYLIRYNLKEQDVEEIREILYKARNAPTRKEPIQSIILEEVESYFSGERSLGDTCDAIQVRVQAYLDSLE